MALENSVPILLALVSFIPAYIGSNLNSDNPWQRILSWALYALSILLSLISVQVGNLVLQRLFGASPTTTETGILNLFTYFMVPTFIYLTLFGLLLCLGIAVYFVQYIQSTRVGKTR